MITVLRWLHELMIGAVLWALWSMMVWARLSKRGKMKLTTMIEKVRAAGYHVRPKRERTGRPRKTDVPRCPCGEMTAARAKARAHHCEVKEVTQ